MDIWLRVHHSFLQVGSIASGLFISMYISIRRVLFWGLDGRTYGPHCPFSNHPRFACFVSLKYIAVLYRKFLRYGLPHI